MPGGYLGTAATIERMREFVTQYKRDFSIRKLAAQIIQNCPAKDYYCYARAIYEFCRDRIKYVYDPHMVELVESPLRILEAGVADCDSICTLMASLNESIGLKTRFRTIKADKKRPDDFSHVYCVVRVPQSRFSTSKISGWIAEDATLPDKQFGWEPQGDFEKKDWAASADKDGEDGDDPLLGDITMNPADETQAQIEIDQLCNALNLKLIDAMRKGLEWSDPKKANILAIVVGRFSQLSNGANGVVGGTSPSQLLPVARNGYAYWSQIIDSAAASIPDFGVTPNLSGYSSMGETDDVLKERIATYLNTVDWKLQNLKASGADTSYPADMSNIRVGLYSMQNAASKVGTVGLERTEAAVQALYKATVQIETDVANRLTNAGGKMVYPDTAPPEAQLSLWGRIKDAAESMVNPSYALTQAQAELTQSYNVPGATSIPTVPLTPMEQMLTRPNAAPKGGTTTQPGGGAAPVSPAAKTDWMPIVIGIAAAIAIFFMMKPGGPQAGGQQ